eukprot:CAMPEP_0197034952 /NCGR_PEP_ID=MMETSP1384-20130603/12870_1 /TAXON_ID=29189 /ORGANISM="Ammonia sp." /LENGTH=289 /DNA_ID=CAMNT_0042464931 /DNA_START=33 /DNA_END=902 /DNA_ORIENTATION=+
MGEDAQPWDDKTMMLKYIKFTNGCLIIDCVEDGLRSVAKVSDLLSFYGLYRQVMSGDNSTPQPSYIYAEKRLKWNAWTKYKGLSKQQALTKWEKLYNKFVHSFPDIFENYPEAELDRYHPIQPFVRADTDDELEQEVMKQKNNEIDELQLEIKGLQMQLQLNEQQGGNAQNSSSNGHKFVTLKRENYQNMIEFTNEIKNKMHKYHSEFETNAKQIKVLEKANADLKHALMQETNKHDSYKNEVRILKGKIDSLHNMNASTKRNFYSFLLCLVIVTAVYMFVKKRKNKSN